MEYLNNKEEFQIFDEKNLLLDYIFKQIDSIIDSKPIIMERNLKIFSCYFGSEKISYENNVSILDHLKYLCKARNIRLELILSKRIFEQNYELIKSKSKYFEAYPNSRGDKLFHGKTIAYLHGKITKKNLLGIHSQGILLKTSANFSKAYLGKNYETGILLTNPLTINSFLKEFQNSKGKRQKKNNLNKIEKIDSLSDFFLDGYILASYGGQTLSSLATVNLKLKDQKLNINGIREIGGKINDAHITFSLDKKYLNLSQFERSFPSTKNLFKRFTLKSPYGLWIHKLVFEMIRKTYEDQLNEFKSNIREILTEDNLQNIIGDLLNNVISNYDLLMTLKDLAESANEIADLKENILNFIKIDNNLDSLFYGYLPTPFPIDPNNEVLLNDWIELTKKYNFKQNPKRGNAQKNFKNLLYPYINNENVDFEEFKNNLNDLIEKLKSDSDKIKSNKILLKIN